MGDGYTRVNKIFSGRSRVCRMLAWHIRLILVPEFIRRKESHRHPQSPPYGVLARYRGYPITQHNSNLKL